MLSVSFLVEGKTKKDSTGGSGVSAKKVGGWGGGGGGGGGGEEGRSKSWTIVRRFDQN